MKKIQYILGFILLIALIYIGATQLASPMLFYRMLFGLGLGYALTRSAMGFAGSVNRAYKFGSTKLMRVLMYMFTVSAIVTGGLLFHGTEGFDLWVNPINLGLVLGGLLFGVGMAFASCCASGVLTDVVTALPRGIIALVFWCIGVYIGFPLQNTQSWIQDSLIKTSDFNGVYFPDLFKWDGLNGYLGASLLTLALAIVVVILSYAYEKHRKNKNTYSDVRCEAEYCACQSQKSLVINDKKCIFCSNTYERLFVAPWSMERGASVIAAIFVIMMAVTKEGWGASTPYGFWFGRVLILFGMSPESVAHFANPLAEAAPIKPYVMPFFEHPIYVQNISIVLGTILALLLAGKFCSTVRSELKITFKEAIVYALGGLLMGFGTRLSNGCNVGALYTPIANFSLSGWVFLVAIVIGGVVGNIIYKALFKKPTNII